VSSWLSSPLGLSGPVMVGLDVVGWAAVHATTGYVVHRLPARRFDRDGWLWRARPFEGGGRLYVTTFRIRRWKRWLPEAGDVFAGGFNKATLLGVDDDYLRTYVRETRRAELGHWLAIAVSPVFFVWNPPIVGVFMVLVYAPLTNGWCILAQRYNRVRLQRVLSGRRARETG
jgi:glycosyl-4,4'-diaponeurosporenoate acyltransferase